MSHRGECQIILNINTPYETILKAVMESPYTDKMDYLEEGKSAGKLNYTIKGLDKVKIQVCDSTTVNIYHMKGFPTNTEFTILFKALKDVFWDRCGNPENLSFRKIVPSPAWMREVFYQSRDGKMLKKLEQRYREIQTCESE